MVECYCLKCSLVFPTLKSRDQHIWYSGIHIYCGACVKRYGNVIVSPEEFDSIDDLRDHCHAHHFRSSYCTNCKTDHHGCADCFDDGIYLTFPNETERVEHQHIFHYQNKYTKSRDCPLRWNDSMEYQCYECPGAMGFQTQKDISSHLRTRHGWVDCPLFFSHSSRKMCLGPSQILWTPEKRGHMEGCHHPNPCNDFDAECWTGLERCPLCNCKFVEPWDVHMHYHDHHPCSLCEQHISTYKQVKKDHLQKCHKPKIPKPKSKPQPKAPKGSERCEDNTRETPAAELSCEGPIDVYAVLDISPQCSQEEAKRAARQSRINTHPDKLKKDGMSWAETCEIDEIAKLVGFAADIVLDPAKRWEYDRSVMEWRNRNWHS